MYPPKYVIRDKNELKIVILWEMNPTAEVVAEVKDDTQNDPIVAMKNLYATPRDFLWPENMFNEEMLLSELKKRLGLS